MNVGKKHPLTVSFGEVTGFALPRPARAQIRATTTKASPDLRQLTRRLVAEHVQKATNVCQRHAMFHAAHEAESLAWLSAFPMLVLPELLNEKVRAAHEFHMRQERLKPCLLDRWADAA